MAAYLHRGMELCLSLWGLTIQVQGVLYSPATQQEIQVEQERSEYSHEYKKAQRLA